MHIGDLRMASRMGPLRQLLPISLDRPKAVRCDISERRTGGDTLRGRISQHWTSRMTTPRTIVVMLAALDEETYYDYASNDLDRWGWQEKYLQLRPEDFASLDAAHDYLMGSPEPASMALFVLGTAAIALRL